MTRTEVNMLHDVNPWRLEKLAGMRESAFAEADSRFPSRDNKQDDQNDAFRHAYWNALWAQEMGSDWTRRYTTAHEGSVSPDTGADWNPPSREAMDLFNNQVGIGIVVANPGATPGQLADLVADSVMRGDMVIIGPGDALYPSNLTFERDYHPVQLEPLPGRPLADLVAFLKGGG